tara:strand:+ start:551 stop:1789 length:1239 start_codon:yes stop_codon:yes gene_type:complete
MEKNFSQNYFFLLFSIIPISIIIGPAISLINILLIDLSFIIFIFYTKKFDILNHPILRVLIVLYIYLIFNSFIALDFSLSELRNFGFIRFIILFLAINYFFLNKKNINLLLKFWFFVILVVLIDSYIELIYGKNILGYGELYKYRVVSFFKDEPIVGAYLLGFILMLSGYLFKNFENKNIFFKTLIIITIFLFITCVLFTGERSNTLKTFFGFLIFFILNHYFSSKLKIYIISIFFFFLSFAFLSSDYLKLRYSDQLLKPLSTKEKRIEFYNENIYLKIYRSGIEVFQNYPIFGVGNKNYRVETCDRDKINKHYYCITHPHQVYIEFLAEHGLFGTFTLLAILFYLIFRYLKIIILSKNLIQQGSFIYLIINFLPILPSGSFFGDFNSTLFWINLSIMYASNPNTNIFKKNK